MKKIFIIIPLLIATACVKNTDEDHQHHSGIVQQQHDLMLSDQQMRLANITTQKIAQGRIGESVALNGRLTINEQQSLTISSRAAGRVERLFIKETGKTITKGQPLYELYSETLLALQQEYLLAKEQNALHVEPKGRTSFPDAAERKLLLYGLTLHQIRQLDKNTISNRVAILAPATGIVTSINVTEGAYIPEGGLIYKIEQLETLWVEAEVYPAEAQWIKNGDIIRIETSNGEKTESVIFQQTPALKAATEIQIIKARFPNAALQYKPGEQVQVYLTRSSHHRITLPSDAVIHDGHGTHVYVQVEKNTFQPRMVKTGMESNNRIEITAGLTEGEVVVVSGAYLMYSENILKNGSAISNHNH